MSTFNTNKLAGVMIAVGFISALSACTNNDAARAEQQKQLVVAAQPIKTLCVNLTDNEAVFVTSRFSSQSLSTITQTIGKAPKEKCAKLQEAVYLLSGLSDPLISVYSGTTSVTSDDVGGQRIVLLSAILAP